MESEYDQESAMWTAERPSRKRTLTAMQAHMEEMGAKVRDLARVMNENAKRLRECDDARSKTDGQQSSEVVMRMPSTISSRNTPENEALKTTLLKQERSILMKLKQ